MADQSTHPPRVVVFHPYGQHSYYLAAAVQRAGLLRAYVARLYYDEGRFPFSLVRFLPAPLKKQVDELLFRRRWKDINGHNVRMVDVWSELLFIALNRLQVARNWREAWMMDSIRRFSKRVADIARTEADMLIGTDGASLDAFRAARRNNILTVLDLAHPHVLSEMKVKETEAQYAPPDDPYDSMIKSEEDIQYHIDEIAESDVFIVASTFSRQTLLDNGISADRIFVVPYGVEGRFFYPERQTPPEPNRLNILFAGIIGQRKGIRYLLEAVHQLRPQFDIRVTITGNLFDVPPSYGPYQDDYVNLKRVPDTQLPTVFAQCDVFVLPTLFEGFGRVILEAMAAGLPVITTPNCGAPDVITEGVEGFIVPERDVDALKEKLLYLFHHPEQRRRMGQLARATAGRYTWERYYAEIGLVLNQIWARRDTYRRLPSGLSTGEKPR